MSSTAKLQQELIGTYINRSANGLFLFDCLITLSQEVDAVWSRKWTATTCLYALTRYGTVMDQILLLIPPWNFVSCSCAAIVYINAAVELLQLFCLAWFSALRVHAILDGKYFMAGMVLLLDLVPFATNTFNAATSVVSIDAVKCAAVPGMPNNLLLSLSLISRVSVIIGDVLVLVVTWTKTAQAYREARQLNIRAPLVTTLFRDGTIYFLLLLVINILEVIQENIPVLLTMNFISPFFDIFPPMIVCHFILSLRQIEPAGSSWEYSNQSHSLRFIGNMGQSLQFGGEGADEEEEDIAGVEGSVAEVNISPEDPTWMTGIEADETLGHRYGIDLEGQ